MSILWIIESQKRSKDSIIEKLHGDFPVQAFRSVKSFLHLQKIRKRTKPDCILIVGCHEKTEIETLFEYISHRYPMTKKIYVPWEENSEIEDIKSKNSDLYVISDVSDILDFSNQIRVIVEGSDKDLSNNIVSYKNICLDGDRLQLKILPDDSYIGVTLKEARILKLFIGNVGRCISRDEIKKKIWEDMSISYRTIDSHISRLRKRLQYSEASIESIYGGGYIFK
ncbi:MAG: winged helix-turn-helix domain-containing protein [Oligoflexales bacterium]|nr:winged helix-turn-helix domain-containing protein [Oligoflexales bacterium]